jgi:hypothetical protein
MAVSAFADADKWHEMNMSETANGELYVLVKTRPQAPEKNYLSSLRARPELLSSVSRGCICGGDTASARNEVKSNSSSAESR